eukprot:365983-Rhodomonas_salina.2
MLARCSGQAELGVAARRSKAGWAAKPWLCWTASILVSALTACMDLGVCTASAVCGPGSPVWLTVKYHDDRRAIESEVRGS